MFVLRPNFNLTVAVAFIIQKYRYIVSFREESIQSGNAAVHYSNPPIEAKGSALVFQKSGPAYIERKQWAQS